MNPVYGENSMSEGKNYIWRFDWERIEEASGLKCAFEISDIEVGDSVHFAEIIVNFDRELQKKNLSIRDFMIAVPCNMWMPSGINRFAAILDYEKMDSAMGHPIHSIFQRKIIMILLHVHI